MVVVVVVSVGEAASAVVGVDAAAMLHCFNVYPILLENIRIASRERARREPAKK